MFGYVALIKSCYLKKPARKALSYAAVSAQTDPLKYNEVILNDCWLAGDEEIKTDNGLFLSVSQKLPLLIEIKEAEVDAERDWLRIMNTSLMYYLHIPDLSLLSYKEWASRVKEL